MNKEPITLHLETFNNEEYILADECIKAIGIHRKTNTKLHKEIKRLKEEYVMLQNASDEVEEEKDKEIERLHSIIKEVREYINKIPTQPVIRVFKKELLEILDKVDKEKE